MPFPKESESAKIQGDKLEHAVDQVAPDDSNRKRGKPPRSETPEKVERERGAERDENE